MITFKYMCGIHSNGYGYGYGYLYIVPILDYTFSQVLYIGQLIVSHMILEIVKS